MWRQQFFKDLRDIRFQNKRRWRNWEIKGQMNGVDAKKLAKTEFSLETKLDSTTLNRCNKKLHFPTLIMTHDLLFKCILVLRTFDFHCKLIYLLGESNQIMWGTKLLLRWEATDLKMGAKTRGATKQRKRRRERRTQSGKKPLCASPPCKKNCNRTQTSAIQFKPNRELSTPHPNHHRHHHHPYQPPSLPQLIFHFSSRAYRMRDVSISRQSFPGLCVTCVVISVWLTGSVVSHCPAASDSHRLTLQMMSRIGAEARCVSAGGKKKKKDKVDGKEGMIEGREGRHFTCI